MAMAVEKTRKLFNTMIGRPEPMYKRLPSLMEQFPYTTLQEKQRRREHVASKIGFNVFIGICILINTVLMGYELDNNVGSKLEERSLYFVGDFIFACIFFAEMLLRQNQLGWEYFLVPWNIFDFAIVVLSCLDVVVAVTSSDGDIKLANSFRIARLLRVSSSISGAKAFYGMWLVIQGLIDSIRTMFWTGVFLVVTIFVFGVAFTTIVSSDAVVKEFWQETSLYAGSVYRSSLTIIQVSTFDRWSDISRVMLNLSPLGMLILFLSMVIINFGIFNIVIALMVERLSTLKRNQEMKNGKFLRKVEEDVLAKLGEDFMKSDTNQNGELDEREFRSLIREKHVSLKLRLLGIHGEEAEGVFELLDADKSGSLTPEEFVSGIQRIRGDARSQDVMSLICFAQRQCQLAKANTERTRRLIKQADSIQARLDWCGRSLSSECEQRYDNLKRRDEVWVDAKLRQKVITEMDQERGVTFPSLPENHDHGVGRW